MIHNNSSDPVLIKKISLRIWTLRDEIEARIQAKVDAGEIAIESMTEDLLEESLKDIHHEYTKKAPLPDNVLQLKTGNDLSNDEDEMARAMAGEESPEQGSEEASEENSEKDAGETPSDDQAEAAAAALLASTPLQDANVINIAVEPPLISEDKISRGKTVLSEIDMEKMLFFSSKPFTEGQSIVIQFCIPKTFLINADVFYCRPFNIKSRIISQNNFSYRMLVKFTFLKEGERALLRQFIQSIETDVTKVAKKVALASADKEESDFGDLDDLGL